MYKGKMGNGSLLAIVIVAANNWQNVKQECVGSELEKSFDDFGSEMGHLLSRQTCADRVLERLQLPFLINASSKKLCNFQIPSSTSKTGIVLIKINRLIRIGEVVFQRARLCSVSGSAPTGGII